MQDKKEKYKKFDFAGFVSRDKPSPKNSVENSLGSERKEQNQG